MNTPGNDDWMPDFEDPETPQRLGSLCPSDETACSRNDVPRTMAFHASVKGTPLERYWSAIGELEKSETMLRKLRGALDDFKGHGMPGFRDRAEAITIMQMVDEFLSENAWAVTPGANGKPLK